MLAIVTGASGGLGLEFAKLLAADGYDLLLVARSGSALDAIAAELRTRHAITVQTMVADLSVVDAATRVAEHVPACDVLINNAGVATSGRFDTIPPQTTRAELLLDIVTLTELCRAYLPGMRERGTGRILNVASTAGFLPGPFMAVYYAAKAYVLSFSQALSEEVRGSGVTVTCLVPGATKTGFAARAAVTNTMLFAKLPTADAASVARAGYRAMLAGKDVEIPGLTNKLLPLLLRLSPRRLVVWLSRKVIEQ